MDVIWQGTDEWTSELWLITPQRIGHIARWGAGAREARPDTLTPPTPHHTAPLAPRTQAKSSAFKIEWKTSVF